MEDLIPTKSSLLSLLNTAQGKSAVVSIYIPTHPSSTSQSLNADMARFKNALQAAEDELSDMGLKQSEIRSILDGAWELYENLDFWQHRGRALAVFLAPNKIKRYRLPIETDELVNVGEHFVLSPLAIAASLRGYRYTLKLELRQPRLFLASWHQFDEVHVAAMPGEMEKALKISGYEQEQQHNALGNGAGKGTAVFHGHGGAKDNRAGMINSYLRMIDAAVSSRSLKYPKAPFVLSGTSELAVIFKSITDKNIEHIIEKDFSDEKKLKQEVIDYIDNQLKVMAKEFASDADSASDPMYENFPFGKLQRMAKTGQIKQLGVGLLNATRDSAMDVHRKITKLDLHMDKQSLWQLENVVRDVLKNGGEISGMFTSGGRRGLQALLRYQT